MTFHGAEYITEIIMTIDYYRNHNKEVPTICELYDMLGERHNKSRGGIEKCIRHAIEKTFERIPFEKIDEVFGIIDFSKERPTNKVFIYCIYSHVKFSEEEND